MTVDDALRFLAPLAPAVLPVIVLVWHQTRRELRGIRNELLELRQRPSPPDPRLDQLLEAVDSLSAEVGRLADVQRRSLPPVREEQPSSPGSDLPPGPTRG